MKRSRFSSAVPSASDAAALSQPPKRVQDGVEVRSGIISGQPLLLQSLPKFVPPPPQFPAQLAPPPPLLAPRATAEVGNWGEEEVAHPAAPVQAPLAASKPGPLFVIKGGQSTRGMSGSTGAGAGGGGSGVAQSGTLLSRSTLPMAAFAAEQDEGVGGAGLLSRGGQGGGLLPPPAALEPMEEGMGAGHPEGKSSGESDALESFMAALPASTASAAVPIAALRPQGMTWEEIQAGFKASAPQVGGDNGVMDEGGSGVGGSGGGGGEDEDDAAEEAYRAAFLAALSSTSTSTAAEEGGSAAAGAGAQGESKGGESGTGTGSGAGAGTNAGATAEDDDDAALFAGEEWGEEISALDVLAKKAAKKSLPSVDHSAQSYAPFRKHLYHPHPSVQSMSGSEVASLRDDLEVKLRGKGPFPNPLSTWEHTGLPDRILATLSARGFAAPFAIQRQALPIIMSGRDVFGVARTGSGKTLAYLLPMLRQILDQPPLGAGGGPIGLILAPARELVTQIYHEAKKLCKALELGVTAVYGGAPIAEQLGALKRGGEVVVATPGRLIDLLSLSQGKHVSLAQVTYVVIDEADRMFDMGFEPQISRLLALVRPDRQMVMFSATFPPQVEALARKALVHSPCEVVVGGRSKASPSITQWVEVRGEGDKFPRLLQVLGEWYEQGGAILVFVDTQEHCDTLWAELNKRGYPAASLHGGKDQVDREQTLADFKAGIRTLMVATSVAGRGLDVKHLVLVINYSCPNHLEDYVHRVGRTGRAGSKGTAFTFITPSEGAFAKDLVRALKDAKQEAHIPVQLTDLVKSHEAAVAAGTARNRGSGFAGAKGGYRFDGTQMSALQKEIKAQKAAFEKEAGIGGGGGGGGLG